MAIETGQSWLTQSTPTSADAKPLTDPDRQIDFANDQDAHDA